MQLSVGCAQWTHAAWQERQPNPRERLRGYADWCTAVEGNTTFYATPARATVQSWARQTPPGFRFVVKLPKTITHERRMRGAEAELREFLAAVEPLESRLHALWVQLPASFGPTDLGALARFLRELPPEYRHAVEVRHPAFFDDPRAAGQLEHVLSRVGAEWIPFDTTVLFAARPTSPGEREAWGKKPRVPRRTRALTDYPIVRYHGRDNLDATVAGWKPWLATVVNWLREGRSPTMFIHTPDNAESLVLARRFHAEVRAELPELEPLPEPAPTTPMTLF
ncbi:DUF72 domain-containing protein [Nocardia terpenica]|uniref:DUF72 domain-containing protein n=1 Tax=Nocardia terpenica TaxID=455432 RepID=A0A161WPZ5_9NOCA|nr:DUF72 domain-containing protein [Nocardia terpenica]KZM75285.1 hypothetical protein AWN90_17935 [Nocardia terpenica]MBF6063642.1 DUF72 domain-containing protein [Nocardia terpenica]MBF6107018.1 DUF72 domain-containing protein [Nocardia terpenica]MBF6114191.1 DUF72 domain-containing protein [Nocardia terpenica]MBF6121722.1 DUF72 domain-containing protein [Nocardia terpenica]